MLVGLIVAAMGAAAVVEGASLAARSRRTAALNCALHELRRPLQAISLAVSSRSVDARGVGACLTQARGALEDLDSVINGREGSRRVTRTALGEIGMALEDRWRGSGVEVAPVEGEAALDVDPLRVGAVLDNLVHNAVEHGSAPVSVRALAEGSAVRMEVRDGGPPTRARPRTAEHSHGHGLRIASDLAASQGGRLLRPSPRPGGGTISAVLLPLPPDGTAPG